MEKSAVIFGELLWDILPSGPLLGGAPANFAYRFQQLGGTPKLVSRIGNDDLGRKAASILKEKNLNLELLQIDELKPTGTVPVTIDNKGKPDFTILPDVAYDYIEPAENLLHAASTASLIYFGTLVQRSAKTRETLHTVLSKAPAEATIFSDINLRKNCYTKETVEISLQACDWLKLNDEEVPVLASMFNISADPTIFSKSIIEKFNLNGCVVTLGEKGAIASTASESVHVPGIKVTIADTIGAGDAFAAGFAWGLITNQSLQSCTDLGNKLGSLVASVAGGMGEIVI